MPYEIIWERRGALKRFWGFVTTSEFLASVADLHNDPKFDQIRYTINDFTESEQDPMTESAIEDTAAVNIGSSFSNRLVKIAIVTTDTRIFDTAKKYLELNPSYPLRIFPTLARAREWADCSGLDGLDSAVSHR